MSKINELLGEIIREARKNAGMTQEDLAFEAELHRTYISLLERGLRSPTVDTFFLICEALKRNPGELISTLYIRLKHDEDHE
jgi:transcriptional regulator with XRE-family HTH domain